MGAMVRRPVGRQEAARLNIITHLLKHIPYEEVPREKVKLPKRQGPGDYRPLDYPVKLVPEQTWPSA